MPQTDGIDRRRHYPVTVTSRTGGTTEHSILALDETKARRAGHAFATAYGHPTTEHRSVVVGDPE